MKPFAYENSFTSGENMAPCSLKVSQLHPQNCHWNLNETVFSWIAECKLMRFGGISGLWKISQVGG